MTVTVAGPGLGIVVALESPPEEVEA
jgi:hypothetical protein